MFQKLINLPLTISALSLISIGILVIFSTSPTLAAQQFLFAVLGMIIFFVISGSDYRILQNFIKPSLFFILFLLILTFIIGFETRGSIRWIPLVFFTVQPSEFAKPVLILFLADFWSKNIPSWKNIFKSLLWSLPIMLL